MEKGSFLEYVFHEVGCECLSDLRLQRKKWISKIKRILAEIDDKEYDVSEWQEVISYLTDSELSELGEIKDTKRAKEYIIDWLEKIN